MCKIIAVTNRNLCSGNFLDMIRRLSESDVESIILREKDLSEAQYESVAESVLAVCKGKKQCILHSYTEVAKKLQHPYIHLPLWKLLLLRQEQPAQLSGFKKIGASVHSSEEAIQAWKAGADYVTAGHVFVTDCKKGVPPRGLDYIREVSGTVPIPVYGIGGITRENMASVIQAGAEGVCIMSGMMTGEQIKQKQLGNRRCTG